MPPNLLTNGGIFGVLTGRAKISAPLVRRNLARVSSLEAAATEPSEKQRLM
jgi:hypothetical protein